MKRCIPLAAAITIGLLTTTPMTACLAAAKELPGVGPYPETDREPVTDTYHGVSIVDPYRWLEEDVRESPRVADWVERQQAFTRSYLDGLSERESFEKRLTELWNYARYSPPQKAGPRYLYRKNDGLQNQSVLYLADSAEADGEVLIDPNSWSEDGTIALAGYSPSHDGRWLAFQRSEAGSDWKTIRVMSLPDGKETGEVIEWVKYSGIGWAPDGSGFYYTRYPEPAEGEAFQGAALNPSICFHRLGTPVSEDQTLYSNPEHPDWSFGVSPTEDGRYLLLRVFTGTDNQNQLLYRETSAPHDAPWTPLFDDFQNEWSPFGADGDRIYLTTDYQAPNRRIVALDLARPGRENLEELVRESDATLEGASYVGGKIFAQYLEDVAAVVRLYDVEGTPLGEVALPGVGSVGGFGGKQEDQETFFYYTSYDAPPTTYRYDIAQGDVTKLREPEVAADLESLEVRREFYTSKDGARVPIFLMHKKGLELDGTNPTLLYGYGGFTISLTPGYSPSRTAWVERGGVLAVANLRGGGEYGEAWHAAGKLDKKQNVFDDFIAAAEWLIDQKITSSKHLAIQGGSNGGLLVGAVMTQRPELFGACLPAVGVMDMLRFHTFTAGQFWRDEFGSADDAEMFPVLRAYSPYHNLKEGVAYPATMVTTADTDDRVVPMHSFKFAAELQRCHAGDTPVLIRIETRAGHGAGTPTSKRIEEAADLWSFLWANVGAGK
ncbi:Prolyl endopeptidase precursor [Pseudobythopirellula maris]|uniref:prolyl oligopeptidase n=1 Tax=Pseudobythopirellula maris TaxID=2527991 RepID=A0A5C5ZNC8_9BACT|nr:prolyl oligopeptidase family serine peptidase [Pseudobythopirellula maris]TWT88670.1 Prolyl endopeptidase precursor [Pseudobythopirellula maris]